MAIDKTGAKILRKFRIPERNIELVLKKTGKSTLELYKGEIGASDDTFVKVADKVNRKIHKGSAKEIYKGKFDEFGNKIASSFYFKELTQRLNVKEVKVNANSIKMWTK